MSIHRTSRTAGKQAVLDEESTGTLLCGDLFTQVGNAAAVTSSDVVGPAIAAEDLFRFSSLHPVSGHSPPAR